MGWGNKGTKEQRNKGRGTKHILGHGNEAHCGACTSGTVYGISVYGNHMLGSKQNVGEYWRFWRGLLGLLGVLDIGTRKMLLKVK